MSKRKFEADTGYPCDPIRVGYGLWCYGNTDGLEVFTQQGLAGVIPWRKIKGALEDHRRAKSRMTSPSKAVV